MGCLTCLQPNPVGIACTTWQLLAFRPPCSSGFHTDVAACYPRPSASLGKLTPGEEHLMPRREKPVDQLFLFIHSCSLPLPISHTQRWLLPSEPCGLPSIHCPEQQPPAQAEDSLPTFQCYWFLTDLISEFIGYLCPRPCSLGLQD